jgi:predicted metalloprotease with PDZ domain
MKKILLLLLATFFLANAYAQKVHYTVDLNDREDDRFKVSLTVSGLSKKNKIYQFAATAPGTYQTMNIGRYVEDFKVFDAKGKKLAVEKKGINQYLIKKPHKVAKIEYKIAETWDVTPSGPGHHVYMMCGTSLEKDHALINGQGVFGYFHGLQGSPISIKLEYPEGWKVGTALRGSNGSYSAKNYDHIVDSPILLGRLTKASKQIAGAEVEIYSYSKTDKIKAKDLLDNMSDMLESAGKFLKKLPVNRYTFLYHFEDKGAGAWEHSYSSEYVMEEQELTPQYAQHIKSIAAHEFFHIVTPLNIHSEKVSQFNFVKPTPSRHLWLYEGTTEWASDMMQLRGGLYDFPKYTGELGKKIMYDNTYYDADYSLLKLSLTSFSDEGQRQYGNIYQRGALVAGLLDIRLLELSGGKKGLREVVLELSKKFGQNKSFNDEKFFETFVAMTYPEIKDFFENYVKNAEELPIKEYYAKLGIDYIARKETGKVIPSLGMQFGQGEDHKIILSNVDEDMKRIGLHDGDQILNVEHEELTKDNAYKILRGLKEKKQGEEYHLKIKRGDQEKSFTVKVVTENEVLINHFEILKDSNENQTALREAWLKNM